MVKPKLNKRQMLRDLVLVKADPARKQTDSGILMYETWDTLPPTGTVLAVGPLVLDVKAGDRVLFERYGSVILDDDERICKGAHIMAVIRD